MAPTAALVQEKFKTARSGCRQPGNVFVKELSELNHLSSSHVKRPRHARNTGEGGASVCSQVYCGKISERAKRALVVQAMTSGPRGCVGFALFLWADDPFSTLVGWRAISSPVSAEQATKEIAGSESFAAPEAARAVGTLTNMSTALEHAQQMFETSPAPAPKRIYNTVGDGEDNSGEQLQLVSRQKQDARVTINVLAFGPSETLDAYLRQNLTGGLGSFVVRLPGTDNIAATHRAKFILAISMVQQ
jgi:hypothetical protein